MLLMSRRGIPSSISTLEISLKDRLSRAVLQYSFASPLPRNHLASDGRFLSGGRSSTGPRAGKLPVPLKLLDGDIDERFVKGSGPGGQKINKVRNCVQLTHRPTGISVSCQDSRELTANRHIARKRLVEKVEFHLRGEESKTGRRIAKIRNKKARSQRKARIKHQGTEAVASSTVEVSSLPPVDKADIDVRDRSDSDHEDDGINDSDVEDEGSDDSDEEYSDEANADRNEGVAR